MPDFPFSYTIANPYPQFEAANTMAESVWDISRPIIESLGTFQYVPPTANITWYTPAPPEKGDYPSRPNLTIPSLTLPPAPNHFSESLPSIDISTFALTAPPISIPTVPAITIGTVPPIPPIGNVTVPDSPNVTIPEPPQLLQISAVPFSGVDLKEGWLDKLQNIPEIELYQPTPFHYTRGEDYSSELLDRLKSFIRERLNGGTGLPPAIEQLIWDRARDREARAALANEAEVLRQAESLGFSLPSGTLAAQMSEARKNFFDKLSGLGRDISIKQAEMEVDNLKSSIEQGLRLENQLMEYSVKIEQIGFEIAKETANSAIQVYNAYAENYKALLAAYQTYAATYKSVIDGELAKVETYKAQIQAEQAKAEANTALVNQYKARIEGIQAAVGVYKSRVEAAQTLVEMEKTKISAAGEQIRAFATQVNAEVAKLEAYKAQIQGESAKAEIFKAQASAFSAQVAAQAERARAYISRYTAIAQAKAAEWEGYKAAASANAVIADNANRVNSNLVEAYKAEAIAASTRAEMDYKWWETTLKQYEAQQNLTLMATKINVESLQAANNARLDAAKVAAQVAAQMAASAYSTIQANVSVSSQTATSQGIQYNIQGELENTVG